jgi:hypothetical protein
MDSPINNPTAMKAMPANSFSRPSNAPRRSVEACWRREDEAPVDRAVPDVVDRPAEVVLELDRDEPRTEDCFGVRRDPGP